MAILSVIRYCFVLELTLFTLIFVPNIRMQKVYCSSKRVSNLQLRDIGKVQTALLQPTPSATSP